MEIFLILCVLFFAFIFLLDNSPHSKYQKKIKQLVEKKGGKDVFVSKIGGDEYNLLFSVIYTDPEGPIHHVKCNVQLSNSELYWSENPIPDMANHKEGMAEIHKSEFDAIPLSQSAKEQMIDDLTDKNEQLRAELKQWQSQKQQQSTVEGWITELET